MQFDVRPLANLAEAKSVPLTDLVSVVEEALTAAYEKTPGSQAFARAVVDTHVGAVTILTQDGDDVTPDDFGRPAAAVARQALTQWMRNLDRLAAVGPWAKAEGTVVSATVVRDRGAAAELRVSGREGTVSCILPAGEQTPGESLEPGTTIAVYVLAANATDRGQVRLTVSRRQPALVTQLLAAHSSALQAQTVRVAAVAREPGIRTKVMLAADLGWPQTVAQVVGPSGVHATAVVTELRGERVDLVRPAADLAQYVKNALTPGVVEWATVTDAQKKAVTIGVSGANLAGVTGTGGVNLRLAKRLTGARIEIVQI